MLLRDYLKVIKRLSRGRLLELYEEGCIHKLHLVYAIVDIKDRITNISQR